MYDLEVERVIKELKAMNANRVVLQVPDGLKPLGFKLSKLIETKSQTDVYVATDPCYGACDLAYETLDQLQADAIVHYGHTDIPSLNNRKVIYVEARHEVEINKPLRKAAKMTRARRIGLLATVQHIHLLKEASSILERLGKKVYIGKADGKLKYDGQVLGCDLTAANSVANKVESFFVVAGGVFHAIGVQASTGKRTIAVDPYQGKAIDITEKTERLMKVKRAILGKLISSSKIGILLSLKPGQRNVNLAQILKEKLESQGKRCVVIVGRELTGLNLNSFTDVDLFVNTACPRIALDDREDFIKPVLNADDLLIYLDSMDQWAR